MSSIVILPFDMESKIDANNRFKLIECDNDVILFGKDTFTVSRFKELLKTEFQRKLNLGRQMNSSGFDITTTLSKISVGGVTSQLNKLEWKSTTQDCQLLKIGSKGWQKGKIMSQLIFTLASQTIEVYLEFCPDEPAEPESPLDDLRQLPEYKQPS